MVGEKQTSPFQFQLGKNFLLEFILWFFCLYFIEYLPDEQCLFILSPFDIVKAERRDYDDHIDFLINKKQFDEAIKAFEKPTNTTEKPKRHTQQVKYFNKINSIESFFSL